MFRMKTSKVVNNIAISIESMSLGFTPWISPNNRACTNTHSHTERERERERERGGGGGGQCKTLFNDIFINQLWSLSMLVFKLTKESSAMIIYIGGATDYYDNNIYMFCNIWGIIIIIIILFFFIIRPGQVRVFNVYIQSKLL